MELTDRRSKAASLSRPVERGIVEGVRAEHADVDFDEVLAAARVGQNWALTVLYRENQPALIRYLRVRAPGEEEDLASEVWVAVAGGIGGFVGGRDGFRRFVFTIARRRAIDSARRRGRQRTDSTSVDALSERAGRDDTEMAALEGVGDEAVRRIVGLLPSDQAEVVLLRVVAGLSVAEVAEVIGRHPSAVSVVQHRALRRLARRLEDPKPL